MIDCFIDSVGLQLCAGTEPASGLYLNSLPGLSVEAVDSIADSEQITYMGVYRDVQKMALAKFNLDVRNELGKCFKLNRDCDYDAMICDNAELLYQPWMYLLGVHTMIYRLNSPRLNWFTTIALEEAKGLKDHYQVEYEASLKAAVSTIDTGDCCLQCAPSPKYVWTLP